MAIGIQDVLRMQYSLDGSPWVLTSQVFGADVNTLAFSLDGSPWTGAQVNYVRAAPVFAGYENLLCAVAAKYLTRSGLVEGEELSAAIRARSRAALSLLETERMLAGALTLSFCAPDCCEAGSLLASMVCETMLALSGSEVESMSADAAARFIVSRAPMSEHEFSGLHSLLALALMNAVACFEVEMASKTRKFEKIRGISRFKAGMTGLCGFRAVLQATSEIT